MPSWNTPFTNSVHITSDISDSKHSKFWYVSGFAWKSRIKRFLRCCELCLQTISLTIHCTVFLWNIWVEFLCTWDLYFLQFNCKIKGMIGKFPNNQADQQVGSYGLESLPASIFYHSLSLLQLGHNSWLHGVLVEDRAKSNTPCVHLHFLVFFAQCHVRKIYCRLTSVYLSMIGNWHGAELFKDRGVTKIMEANKCPGDQALCCWECIVMWTIPVYLGHITHSTRSSEYVLITTTTLWVT